MDDVHMSGLVMVTVINDNLNDVMNLDMKSGQSVMAMGTSGETWKHEG